MMLTDTEGNRKKRIASLVRPVVILGAAISGVGGFSAAEAEPATQTQQAIEEVVVTARKRPERLQETPVSVTAFTSDDMLEGPLTDLASIADYTPNLEFSSSAPIGGAGNAAIVFIRGVGQTDFIITTDPGVGIFLDSVYIGRAVGGVFDLMDFERVEVLRGPQGTLFGKNTIGGAISLVSKKPDDEFSGHGQLSIGKRDLLNANAAVNLPIAERRLSARVALASRDQDGFVERIQDGRLLGEEDSKSGRGALKWMPRDDLEILLSVDQYRERTNGAPIGITHIEPSAQLATLYNALVAPAFGTQFDERWKTGDPYTTNGTGFAFSDTDVWGTSANLNWDMGKVQLTSISAYREIKSEFGRDADNSPLPYVSTADDISQEQFSQELQLTGLALDDRLNWLTGLYFLQEKASQITDINLVVGLYDALESLPGPLGPGAPGGPGNPLNIALDLDMESTLDTENSSYAAFTQATFALNDQFSVTGGIRYSYDKKRLLSSLYRQSSNVFAFVPTRQSESWSSYSPHASIEYQWTSDLMTYASISRGFKSGGFNGRPVVPEEIQPYDPEQVTAYEVGLKSDWLERRLRLNAAYFFNDYKDMQLTLATVAADGGFIFITENAAKARIQGVELEIVARPVAGLDLSAGAGYLDASYERLEPGATVTTDTELPKTPEWSFNATAQYSMTLGNLGIFTLRGDYSYKSHQFHDTANSIGADQSAYSLINARVSFKNAMETWRVSLFGRNLGDKQYVSNALGELTNFGYTEAYYGRPREWGVSLDVWF